MHPSAAASSGPSPRVRGTRRLPSWRWLQRRSIPACAGNTLCTNSRGFPSPVHPRVCGEHWRLPWQAAPGWRSIPACAGNTAPTGCSHETPIGPSPRVRGTPGRHHRQPARRRSIPACAGNTRFKRWLSSDDSVHPRVCGEHCLLVMRRRAIDGPSPRVRGTRIRSMRTLPTSAVHPRVCGEHSFSAQVPCQEHRSIPACAGNTL